MPFFNNSWDYTECFCDLCLGGFHKWLEEKYGNLDALNEAYWSAFWSHRYSRFDEVDPRDGTIDASGLDWRRYVAGQTVDYFRVETEPLKRLTPHLPITTNHMGTHKTNDYDLLRSEIDVVSQDMYPGYRTDHCDLPGAAAACSFELDFIRCIGGEARRWFTMESAVDSRGLWGGRFGLKPDGAHGLEMLQHMAHGSEGTIYFQWRKGRGGSEKFHSAVVSHTGGENTRVFGEVQKWSARHGRLDKVLGSLNRSDVAIIYDTETNWAADSSEFQRAANDFGMGSRFYLNHIQEWHRPFWDRGISTDVVDFKADWADYKMVVLPLAYVIDQARAEKVKDYVANGGHIFSGYYCGTVNATGLCHIDSAPGLGLDEIFGIWAEEYDLLRPETRFAASSKSRESALPLSYKIRFINGHIHARDAEVLAVCDEGLFVGKPLLTRRRTNNAVAWFLGSAVDAAAFSSIVGTACREANIEGWLPDSEALPEGVTVQTRYSAEKTYRFFLNFTPQNVSVSTGGRELTDLESGLVAGEAIELGPWGNCVMVES
jgi:beta-galactosidase